MRISAKAILFDLDGTLTHSAPDLQSAANAVCRARGWEEFDLDTIITFVGNGIPKLVERVFKARDASIEEADYQVAVMDFLAFYDQHTTDLTKPYDGVVDALRALKAQNIPLGVVTNKPRSPAKKILEELGLDGFFSVVIGGDTTHAKKPDPAPYLAACKSLGLDASDTIYVGDSEHDGETAAGLNVPFILCTGGYRNTPVEEIIHWRAIDSFSDLEKALKIGKIKEL